MLQSGSGLPVTPDGPIPNLRYRLAHTAYKESSPEAQPQTFSESLSTHLIYTMFNASRKIGDSVVSAIGYGAMGISRYYGAVLPTEERLKVRRSWKPLKSTIGSDFVGW